MHPRQKQINEMMGGRDPSLLFEGKTAEQHAKSLTEATESTTDVAPSDARATVTEKAKKASLKDKLPSITEACDGTRDKALFIEAFDR